MKTDKSKKSKDIYEKYKKYEHKYHELIKKRLQKSIYPTQGNDFFFLTIPKGFPDAGREVPCPERAGWARESLCDSLSSHQLIINWKILYYIFFGTGLIIYNPKNWKKKIEKKTVKI